LCCNGGKAAGVSAEKPADVPKAVDRNGLAVSLVVVPNCEHWRDAGVPGGGYCRAEKYHMPSLGVCLMACKAYTGPLADRIERAFALNAGRPGVQFSREQVEAVVKQADPASIVVAEKEAIKRMIEVTPWRFERWAGVWWMGEPWPRRLTFRKEEAGPDGVMILTARARRDGLLFWTRFVPWLRERVRPGCGCVAALKIARDCWSASRMNMRKFIAGQAEVSSDGGV